MADPCIISREQPSLKEQHLKSKLYNTTAVPQPVPILPG